jgi:hypothetical protein
MTFLLNFIKIYQLVQKLSGGKHRQTGDLISLTLLFKESEVKKSDAKSLRTGIMTTRHLKTGVVATPDTSCVAS